VTTSIEVLELRRIDRGSLKAAVKVRLGPVVIHGVRIVQQVGGAPWLALPQTPARRKRDGSGSGWARVVEIVDPATSDQLQATVLAALQAALQ
jgi:DNA-binding cell septation regulator SpoVG